MTTARCDREKSPGHIVASSDDARVDARRVSGDRARVDAV